MVAPVSLVNNLTILKVINNVLCRLLYYKEVELRAKREEETFSVVAEFCFHLSLRQGWFQLLGENKLPGGRSIRNRDGSRSLKPKGKESLMYEASLKAYDETK